MLPAKSLNNPANPSFFMRKNILLILIFFIFLIIGSSAVLSATQTISVVEPSKESASEGKTIWQILKPFMWGGLIIIIILELLIWGVWWLMKKIKEGTDVWFKIMKDKKHLCKMHRDNWRVHAFFRFHKNQAIRIYYINDKSIHSKVVGWYKGHFISRDGNITIMFNFRRKWLVFPKNDLLIINSKKEIIIPRKEVQEGKIKEIKIIHDTLILPQNIATFNPDEVIINAYGIDMDYRTEFFIPVLKDKEGNVINMPLPTYESMKQVAIEGYLYDQTDDFVKVAKKSIDLNPLIRGVNKVSDSSSSIETQPQQMRAG